MNVTVPRDAVERAVAKAKPVYVPMDENGKRISHSAKLRARHHTLARLVAANLPKAFICKRMGMTFATLSLLIDHTPAFQQLVTKYRESADEPDPTEYIDILERVMIAAELEIQDRLLEEPEKLSISELHKISRDAADRLGYSKQAVNLNVNVTLAERLEGLRRRSKPPAGAGDGGGALSSVPRGSAPPLLDLKAETGALSQSTPPKVEGAPPSQPPSEGVMSLGEVLARHTTDWDQPKCSRYSRAPVPPDAATRAMSDRIRPRNVYANSEAPILREDQKLERRL